VSAAVSEGAPIELRGVMETRAGMSFCIFDPAKKVSVWVGLDEQRPRFRRQSLTDATNENADGGPRGPDPDARDARGEGRVVRPGRQVPAPLPAPGMPSVPTPVTQSVVVNPSAADEARRLEAVATEVRRRRALREQASIQPPTVLPLSKRRCRSPNRSSNSSSNSSASVSPTRAEPASHPSAELIPGPTHVRKAGVELELLRRWRHHDGRKYFVQCRWAGLACRPNVSCRRIFPTPPQPPTARSCGGCSDWLGATGCTACRCSVCSLLLLAMGIGGLSFTGLGIDYIRHQLDQHADGRQCPPCGVAHDLGAAPRPRPARRA